MPINPDAVGSKSERVEVSWTQRDALLYAISVGAGTNQLEFTTENTKDVTHRVLPTFPVVVGWGRSSAMKSVGSFNPAMLVHAQQGVRLHTPIPADGTVQLQSEITGIFDKAKAALITSATTATLLGGEPLYTLTSAIFIRGEGGWGGDRGPSGDVEAIPDRAPDHVVSEQTSLDQALIYRLNGDRNPLHSDPSFAAAGGFAKPILHGLCTYGFAGRALLDAVADGDPDRVTAMDGRFSAPVLPGDLLETSVWRVGDERALFTTAATTGTGASRIVIDRGVIEVKP